MTAAEAPRFVQGIDLLALFRGSETVMIPSLHRHARLAIAVRFLPPRLVARSSTSQSKLGIVRLCMLELLALDVPAVFMGIARTQDIGCFAVDLASGSRKHAPPLKTTKNRWTVSLGPVNLSALSPRSSSSLLMRSGMSTNVDLLTREFLTREVEVCMPREGSRAAR